MSNADFIQYGIGAVGGVLVLVWLWREGLLPGQAGAGRGASIGRDVSGVPAAIWLVCTAAVFLALNLGASFTVSLGSGVLGSPGSMRHQALSALCFFGAGAVAAGVMLYLIVPRTTPATGVSVSARTLGGDASRGTVAFVLVAPLYICAAGISQWVSERFFHVPTPRVAHAALDAFVRDSGSVWGLLFAAVAVGLTPIAEEVMYRAFLQSFFLRLFDGFAGGDGARPARGTVWSAIGVTSVIFAVLHALPGGKDKAGAVPWVAVPGLLVLALGMGLAYERTRRLGVPIVMHGLFNLANLVLAAT